MSITVEAVKAEYRNNTGKGASRELRRNAMVPAVIYGRGKENVNVAVDAKEMNQRMHKSGFMSKLLNIEVDGDSFLVLPYSVQLHPVTDNIEHIDFIHVDENSEIKVHVKLHFLNQDRAIGIKRGGVLNIVRRDIELVCNPHKIPVQIDIDLIDLDIAHSIHVNDLNLPEGSKFSGTENVTLVTLVGRADDKEATQQAS